MGVKLVGGTTISLLLTVLRVFIWKGTTVVSEFLGCWGPLERLGGINLNYYSGWLRYRQIHNMTDRPHLLIKAQYRHTIEERKKNKFRKTKWVYSQENTRLPLDFWVSVRKKHPIFWHQLLWPHLSRFLVHLFPSKRSETDEPQMGYLLYSTPD